MAALATPPDDDSQKHPESGIGPASIRMPGRDHIRLSRAEQGALLERILRRSAHVHGAPSTVVAFDLDGTLMDNRPRTCAILHEFASARRARDEELGRRL